MSTTTILNKQEEAVTENPIQIRTSDPGSPVTNQLWINTTSNEVMFYDGTTKQTIGITTKIFARAHKSGTMSLPNGTTVIVDYDVVDSDVNSTITTGGSWHFTAPSNGDYYLSASFGVTSAGGTTFDIEIFKNGSSIAHSAYNMNNNETDHMRMQDVLALVATDTIDIRITQSSGGGSITATTANRFAIQSI